MIDLGYIELAWWQAILAVIVGVVGAARLTRIITHDDYPPAIALRVLWQTVTKDGPWAKLITCPWCAGPWVALVMLGTFLLTPLALWVAWAWWLFWGWLCLSYFVSQYVYWDEGKGD